MENNHNPLAYSKIHEKGYYYTNNFYLAAKDIALLYRYRWQVELFFYDKNIIMY